LAPTDHHDHQTGFKTDVSNPWSFLPQPNNSHHLLMRFDASTIIEDGWRVEVLRG
jgi:hypothetical protein